MFQKSRTTAIIIDPHLFADHIDGGFIMEFNRAYDFTDSTLK